MTSGIGSTPSTEAGEVARNETQDLISSKKIEGTPVYNRAGEKLGTVDSFMVDKRSGKAACAVMSFGGFLGLGESYHPLPWEALTYDTGQDGYVVDLDKSKLEGAPRYGASDDPFLTEPGYGRRVYDHYGLAFPYGGI